MWRSSSGMNVISCGHNLSVLDFKTVGKCKWWMGLPFQKSFNFFSFLSFSQDYVSKQLTSDQPGSSSIRIIKLLNGYFIHITDRNQVHTWKSLWWGKISETNDSADSKPPWHNRKIIQSLLSHPLNKYWWSILSVQRIQRREPASKVTFWKERTRPLKSPWAALGKCGEMAGHPTVCLWLPLLHYFSYNS